MVVTENPSESVRQRLQGALVTFVIVVIYAAFWHVSAILEYAPHASLWFAPAGLVVAVLLLWRRSGIAKAWISVLALSLSKQYSEYGAVSLDDNLFVSFAIATTSTLPYWLAVVVFRRLEQSFVGGVSRALIRPIAYSALMLTGSLGAAVFGVLSLVVFADLPVSDGQSIWLAWWVGDFVGVTVLAPALVIVGQRYFRSWIDPGATLLVENAGDRIAAPMSNGSWISIAIVVLLPAVVVILRSELENRLPVILAFLLLLLPIAILVTRASWSAVVFTILATSILMIGIVRHLGVIGDAIEYQATILALATTAFYFFDFVKTLRLQAKQVSRTGRLERKRLARVLHDHVQQLIVAARVRVSLFDSSEHPESIRVEARRIEGTLLSALEASRTLSVNLSPPILELEGLVGALKWLARRMENEYALKVRFHADSSADSVGPELRFAIFEATRELLLNVIKHAGVDQAEVSLRRLPGNLVQVVVEDSGSGFDSSKLGANSIDAVGFGLFNIQERLTDLGGVLEIESQPAQGTRASIRAHLGEAESAGRSEVQDESVIDVSTPQLGRQEANCRVLIVDDHSIVRKGLTSLLQSEQDFEVVGQVGDGPAAIQAVKELAPDVVLMDVNLGEMDGIEATRRILDVRANTEVIGLSMYVEEKTARAMLDAGASAYLEKAGAPEDLIETIRTCADQRATRSDCSTALFCSPKAAE